MSELAQFMGARFSTAIIKCPTGKYVVRGSVPVELADTIASSEEELIAALLGLGFDRFQLSDCSWYRPTAK